MVKATYEDRHKVLVEQAGYLFSKKKSFDSLNQALAENFYPERADFTYSRNIGLEFADYLATSYPVLVRRDLGNSLSAMLRPAGQTWAHMISDRPDENLDNDSRGWLEQKTKVMFRAMNDPVARFTRATKEADMDFATFGQAVISLEVNWKSTSLLYRTWHLRDVAWCERPDGSVGKVFRKWKPTASDLLQIFGETAVHPKIKEFVKGNGGRRANTEIDVMHIVVPAEEYNFDAKAVLAKPQPYYSIYIDITNKHVIEEKGIPYRYYIVPRWQTVSGSQYAFSPASVVGLADARLLQQITFTLLKAGEKAVDPPMIGVEEMIKSPIDIRPGRVTWVDADYDEKTGEVLRPMTVDGRGIPVGLNMQDRLISTLNSIFYLDKLSLPQFGPEMTAFEVSQRIQEYIRQAIPLFEPIEQEYNAPLCEETFRLLLLVGAFGTVDEIPEPLQGRDIRFRFESPLLDASDQKLTQTYQNAANLIAIAVQADPSMAKLIDQETALRDTLLGSSTPSKWLINEESMAQVKAETQKKQQEAEQLQAAAGQAQVVEQTSAAIKNVSGAKNG